MSPPLCFFGCSHVSQPARAAWRAKMAMAGRGICNGRAFYDGRFSFDEAGNFTVDDAQGMVRYAEFLEEAKAGNFRDLHGAVLVTSLGFQLDLQIWAIAETFTLDPQDKNRDFMSAAVFRRAVIERRQKILALLDWIKAFGIEIISFGSPPRNEHRDLVNAAEDIITEELERRGIAVHLPRHWSAGSDGLLKAEYVPSEKPSDRVHGNIAYGEELLKQLLPLIEQRQKRAAMA